MSQLPNIMSDTVLTQRITPRLHELLGIQEIEDFRAKFDQNQSFSPHELRKLLLKYGVGFTEEQFKTIFLRVGNQVKGGLHNKEIFDILNCYV